MEGNFRDDHENTSRPPKLDALINENRTIYQNEAVALLGGKEVTKVINNLNLIFYKERSWIGYKLTEKSNSNVILSSEVAQLNLLNENDHVPKVIEMLAKGEIDALTYRHI